MVKICQYCGKEYSGKGKKYCSHLCASSALSRKQSIVCPVCGKSAIVRNGHIFCSPRCANTSRRKPDYRPRIQKYCVVCGRSFTTIKSDKLCCSGACTKQLHKQQMLDKYGQGFIDAVNSGKAGIFNYLWTTEDFRKQNYDRMTKNNPVYMDGVIDKAKRTRLIRGRLPNNFKYGNGKITPQEQIAKDYLSQYGFYYNYAIPTKTVRDMYVEEHYAVSYKPDFVNLEHKLCIEIDGKNHTTKRYKEIYDAKKEKCLSLLGYSVVRFTNEQVDNGEFFAEVNRICQGW